MSTVGIHGGAEATGAITGPLGQDVMADSVSVTIASDQSAVPTNPGVANTSGTLNAAGDSVVLDVSKVGAIAVQITQGGFPSGLVKFQATVDGTNWKNIYLLDVYTSDRVSYPTAEEVSGLFIGNVAGYNQFRCLADTGLTGPRIVTIHGLAVDRLGDNVRILSGVDNTDLFTIRHIQSSSGHPTSTAIGLVTRQVGLPDPITPADNLSNSTQLTRILTYGMVFDGTTWDRMRGDSTDGLLVNLGTNNDIVVSGTVNTEFGTHTTVSDTLTIDGATDTVVINDLQGVASLFVQHGTIVGAGVRFEISYNGTNFYSHPCVINAVNSSNVSTLSFNYQNSSLQSSTSYMLWVAIPGGAISWRIKSLGGATGSILVDILPSAKPLDATLVQYATSLVDSITSPVAPAVGSFGMVYDGATWDRARGDSTNGLLVNLGANSDVSVSNLTPLIAASGSVSASGNNTLITPTAGKKIRLYYVSYNPSAAVEVAFRFGAAGTLFLRNNLTTGGSVIAKDFGEFKYLEGAADELLILNLSGAVATIWNVFYTEI